MLFKELSEQEYDQFARKHAYRNFLNSKDAFMVKKEAGFSCFFVGVVENGEILAASGIVLVPVLRFFTYAYAQRGFLIEYCNLPLLTYFVYELKRFLKAKHVLFLKMDPYIEYQDRNHNGEVIEKTARKDIFRYLSLLGFKHLGFTTGFKTDSQCRFVCTLSLQGKTIDDIFKKMNKKTQDSIQKAKRYGVRIKELKEEDMTLFKSIMDDTAMRRHFVDMCLEKYMLQRKVYGEDNAKICMAYLDVKDFKQRIMKWKKIEEQNLREIKAHLENNANSKKYHKKKKVCEDALARFQKMEDECKKYASVYGDVIPLSVAYFIYYEGEVTYISSGSIHELRQYEGPYAIQWHMINESLKKGINVYNFYGTSGDFSKEAIDYGVFCFKKGFGAIPKELVGEFVLIVQKSKYRFFKWIYRIVKRKRYVE